MQCGVHDVIMQNQKEHRLKMFRFQIRVHLFPLFVFISNSLSLASFYSLF